MSFRTIIVGIIAAVCGTFATAGMMILYKPASEVAAKPTVSLLVAKVDLELGQQISENMVSSIEWFSPTIPPHAVMALDGVVGKYVVNPINAGETILDRKIGDTPSKLQCIDGMRAFAIEVKSVSTSVGQNLVPGNRVDIIWQTSQQLNSEIDPIAIRLLQNVKILDVSEVKSSERSITLEVKPKMDEDLLYAQKVGTLALSLRNPNDAEGVEPIESVNLRSMIAEREADLLAKKEAEKKPQPPTEWENLISTFASRMDKIELQMTQPVTATKAEPRTAFEKIEKGMRAITILTPDESFGVAGLLEPGDRVDLHFTLAGKSDVTAEALRLAGKKIAPVTTLIENLEVLAVDSQLYTLEQGDEKKMSRSVTLIILDSMQQEITRAEKLGNLTLTLRGQADRDSGPARTVTTIDEFLAENIPDSIEQRIESTPTIRTYRGQTVNEIPFAKSKTY